MKKTHAITKHLPLTLAMVVAFACLSGLLVAQGGWELYYGGSAEDYAEGIVQTRDHGFIIAGYSESFGTDNDLDVYLIRTDVDGEIIWMKVIDEGWIEHAFDIIHATDGGYIVVGDITTNALTPSDMYMLKIDEGGNVLWTRQFGGNGAEQAFAITATPDGGYLLVGRSDSFSNGEDDIYIVKTDAAGNFQWDQVYGDDDDEIANDVIAHNGGFAIAAAQYVPGDPSPNAWLLLLDANGQLIQDFIYGAPNVREEALGIAPTPDGGLIITGLWGNNSDAFLLKTDANGNQQWIETYGGAFAEIGRSVHQLESGDFVVVGTAEVNAFDADIYLFRTSSSGQLLWERHIGRNTHWDEGSDAILTADGSIAIAGINSLAAVFINDVTLVKADLQGNVRTNYFLGNVFFDTNQDCNLDPNERGLEDWILKATGPNGTFYASTDAQGNYSMRLEMGTYNLVLVPRNPYWSSCVDTFHNIHVTADYDSLFFDFAVHKQVACPALQVDVSTAAAVSCQTNTWAISYCNQGPTDALNARIELILSKALTFETASVPPTLIQDSLIVFELGTIPAGDCGRLTMDAFLDCTVQPQQAVSVWAHIYPDSICLPANPAWDGASIRVSGQCTTDSVRFTIENVGSGDASQPLRYIVIEDVILRSDESHQMQSGQSMTRAFARNGATWRIVAQQSPFHPGNSYPTVAVEGCADAGMPFSTGMVTQYPEDEKDIFQAIDVQESVSQIQDAPLLRGYPKGYGDSMFITQTTDIDYVVRFVNNGSDTVTRIVIRDTLSPWLSVESIEKGASSHPYDLIVYDQGIVKIVIEDIILASNGSGSGTSGGFVQFRISQKPANPSGTHIYNRAVAYVGYEPPQETPTTLHIVEGGELTDFLVITSTSQPNLPGLKVHLWPNPFRATCEVKLEGAPWQQAQWEVTDLTGRTLLQGRFVNGQTKVNATHLPKGMYLFRIYANGNTWYTAKMIAQ